jgi:hypothetical protein
MVDTVPKIRSPLADPAETVSVPPDEMVALVSTPPLTTSEPPFNTVVDVTLPPLSTRSSFPDDTVKLLVVLVVTDVVVMASAFVQRKLAPSRTGSSLRLERPRLIGTCVKFANPATARITGKRWSPKEPDHARHVG